MKRRFKAKIQTIRKEIDIDFVCSVEDPLIARMWFIEWIYETYGTNEKGNSIFLKILYIDIRGVDFENIW